MNKIIMTLALVLVSSSVFSQWNKINSFPNTGVNDIFISGNTVYAATANNGIYRSTDMTATWQQFNNGLNNLQAIHCAQIIQTGSILYAATEDGIYRSTDNAASWIKKSDGILIGSGSIYLSSQSIFEHNGILFTGTYSGIYRSTNSGENWLATNISGTHIWAKNFTLHNGIIFAARESINNPTGYSSTDNGITWSNLQGPSFFSTITFFSEPGKLFTGTIHGAWLSTNNGINWVERSAGLTPDPYNSSFVRTNGVLVSSLKFGGSGMFKSNNDGILWENFGQGLPFLNSINEVIIFNSNILAATSSGIYQRNTSEVTGFTQVSTEIPGNFSLSQNYPNPFNPSSKIRFSIPQTEKSILKVTLTVYDITGRKAALLVNNNMKAGEYEADFNASSFASGIYFYRLEVLSNGNNSVYSEVKKMSLVK
ncbi:MAG: T9SS type A sorting domain-containing protein [Ignavibacteria bacterium]|nr:T9SS type A sorting domain-containing protein [Ignavibacteria bacterium]